MTMGSIVDIHPAGQSAKTEFSRLGVYRLKTCGGPPQAGKAAHSKSEPSESPLFSLIEARPRTGRTHQIRAHLALGLQMPLIGDHKYGSKAEISHGRPLAVSMGFVCAAQPPTKSTGGQLRMLLHAAAVQFVDRNGAQHTAVAPLPEEFLHALQQLEPVATV